MRTAMAPKLRILYLFLLTMTGLYAQRAMTTAEVVAFVKSQIRIHGDDRATADFLTKQVKLTQKLDDRAIEDLQGQGVGPRTIQALHKLRDESAGLPAPPLAEAAPAAPSGPP